MRGKTRLSEDRGSVRLDKLGEDDAVLLNVGVVYAVRDQTSYFYGGCLCVVNRNENMMLVDGIVERRKVTDYSKLLQKTFYD